ncbi:MAG: hypothetical protein CMN72_08330 [Sphingomonas sp.]|nr:hypothetical protein [Sphingomonas sp.]
MKDGTPYGRFEDDLFVRMLNLEREGAGPVFDIEAATAGTSIEFRGEWGRRFIADNKDWFGKSHSTMQSLRFELSPAGRQHALEIESQRLPKTWRQRFAELPWTGLWAFVAAVAALIAALPTISSWFN